MKKISSGAESKPHCGSITRMRAPCISCPAQLPTSRHLAWYARLSLNTPEVILRTSSRGVFVRTLVRTSKRLFSVWPRNASLCATLEGENPLQGAGWDIRGEWILQLTHTTRRPGPRACFCPATCFVTCTRCDVTAILPTRLRDKLLKVQVVTYIARPLA